MKSLVLIDALYINSSGGLRLLKYLVTELHKRKVDFFLLADIRCSGVFDEFPHVEYMMASLCRRRKWYQRELSAYTSVLCFGNIPVPVEMDVPVYTYFHNINLLTLGETYSIKEEVISWLKREVFKHYKNNTDYWLVQTSNTAKELIINLKESPGRVKLMPFYELPDGLSSLKNKKHSDDYVFVSDYTGAKGHEELLSAWEILSQRGINRTLHLTVHERNTSFIEKVDAAREKGVQVINHGFISFEEVVELYRKSKAIIYPSHNESLGLGIVEGITAGCDVIGADLPYTHSICKPSLVFDPYSVESITDAVMEYENGGSKKSELTIFNHISELIELITR